MSAHRQELLRAGQHYREGQLLEAEAICRRILDQDRNEADALQLLGSITLRRGDRKEAARLYARCLKLEPERAHFHYLAGKVHADAGDFERAIACYDEALARDAWHEHAITWKAYALDRMGRLDEARAVLDRAVDAGRDSATMADIMAGLEQSAGNADGALAVVRRHLDGNLSPLDRKLLSFRLGRLLDRAGAYDEAFAAFQDANRLATQPFDRAAYRSLVDRTIATFSADNLATLPRARAASSLPVFIAGMPRSGTTLVEQIIDRHPAGHGAGELTDLEFVVRDLPQATGGDRPFPECVLDLPQRTLDRLSRGYLSRIRRFDRAAERIVNKSLLNYRFLGLIALLFPGARVIHCRRDPRDTCLSCYFSYLLPESNPFASDLADLGFAYREYERLMQHWAEVLPLPILEVPYEAVVDDAETWIRRIVDFLGLPWHDACLDFHTSGRAVRTLSYDQVRRPIYRSSIARHEHYTEHLEPLRRALTGEEDPIATA